MGGGMPGGMGGMGGGMGGGGRQRRGGGGVRLFCSISAPAC